MSKKNYRLWTPIANAFEVYRRRVLAEPDAIYEHVWRLIQIQEALVVTLGSVLASRLLNLWVNNPEKTEDLNRLRVLVTGMSDPNDDTDNGGRPPDSYCLNGSIKAWIDLLHRFGRTEFAADCEFCNLLSNYLQDETQSKLAFWDAWQRISPVPNTYSNGLPRVGRFAAINMLRNKIAHVPLPHRVLKELHWGLRQEILSALSPEYNSKNDDAQKDPLTTKFHKSLLGRITLSDVFVSGSAEMGQLTKNEAKTSITTVEPDGSSNTNWTISPFIRFDKELKVSLLFRLLDVGELNDVDNLHTEKILGEFHRFAAEVEPVQTMEVDSNEIKKWVPEKIHQEAAVETPNVSGIKPDSEASLTFDFENKTPRELRSIAETAFRERNYSLAANAFEQLSKSDDKQWYNDVAKSKHGAALWRAAEFGSATTLEREENIKRSILLLDEATKHRDPRYAARAFYEKSKALWHLWMRTQDKDCLKQAVTTASDAAKLDYQQTYINWSERVGEDLDLTK